MHKPMPHLSRTSLQMFSGAAGLIAAFVSISLLLSLPGPGADVGLSGLVSWGRTTITALTVVCSVLAYSLLRFSLAEEERPAGFQNGAQAMGSRKVR